MPRVHKVEGDAEDGLLVVLLNPAGQGWGGEGWGGVGTVHARSQIQVALPSPECDKWVGAVGGVGGVAGQSKGGPGSAYELVSL